MGIIMTATSAAGQVELYDTLSVTFLIIGILFFLLSVLLFFLFKVANILAVKTGRAQRRTIKEMESINAETGRLHSRIRRSDAAQRPVRKEMWNTSRLDDGEKVSLDTGDNETTVLSAVNIGMNDTRALGEDTAVEIGKFVIVREIVMIHTEEVV